jgi:hypothetical protein
MAHLLARLVVEAVGEVDFVIEEGALCGCCRHDGDLGRVRGSMCVHRQGDKPTVSESSLRHAISTGRTQDGAWSYAQQDLHFRGAARGAVTDRHHPTDVASHGLRVC